MRQFLFVFCLFFNTFSMFSQSPEVQLVRVRGEWYFSMQVPYLLNDRWESMLLFDYTGRPLHFYRVVPAARPSYAPFSFSAGMYCLVWRSKEGLLLPVLFSAMTNED
jgi:hypothetical protein